MKKLLAIVLSVAMIACFASVAFAAGEENVTATVATVNVTEADVGSEVILDVSLSDNVEFGYAAFKATVGDYDTEALEFIGWTDETNNIPKPNMKATTAENGKELGWILNGQSKGGVFYALKFKVLKATNAAVTVNFSDFSAYDTADLLSNALRPVNVNVVAGGIAVASETTDVTTTDVTTTDVTTTDVTTTDVTTTDVTTTTTATTTTTGDTTAATSVAGTVTGGTTTGTNTANPKSSDASAVAVAGVLCAAMAAAFVITKKSK